SVILYTVGEAGGWVNEDGHFAVWSNFRYAGICLTGLRTERVSGSAKGGPYAVPSMFFLTKLIPDGSPDQWLCLVWSQVNVQLPQGWVFDGAYDFVTIPKATTIPAAMTFNFHATPL
ncbi:MAG TPA: hypothetical protein VJ574_06300, partial [Candidatus Bathyarchaeia archaeon]|nr:hypothetical protein [Candidatus Bathyarchaeia archaeon]